MRAGEDGLWAMQSPPYSLTMAEAAGRLGVSPKTIQSAIRNGNTPLADGMIWGMPAGPLQHYGERR